MRSNIFNQSRIRFVLYTLYLFLSLLVSLVEVNRMSRVRSSARITTDLAGTGLLTGQPNSSSSTPECGEALEGCTDPAMGPILDLRLISTYSSDHCSCRLGAMDTHIRWWIVSQTLPNTLINARFYGSHWYQMMARFYRAFVSLVPNE